MKKQQTIAKAIEFSGLGIHTGKDALVRILPAHADSGVVFKKGGFSIAASVKNVVSTVRSTTLGAEGITVHTVEHLMAALYASGIDNAIIEMEGGDEIPIGDGSALFILSLIKDAGIKELSEEKKAFKIKNLISFRAGKSFIAGYPAGRFSLSVMVDYGDEVIGRQFVQYDPEKMDFFEKIAPARTFAFEEEVKKLREAGFAQGGSLNNALIITKGGYMNQSRFEDEVARHKCLDLIGDLALCGMEILGHIFAYRPGHGINTDFVKKLLTIQDYK